MFLNNSQQDGALSRDEMRIKLKREANEQRRLRLLDARKRVIGLDVDALNEQVAEKERMKSDMKEIERLEKLRMLEIEKVLEAASEEERQMREFQKQELKKSWEESIHEKNSRPADPKFNINETGLSAAQVFAGEDRNQKQRIAAQRQQMKRWIQEQIADHSYATSCQKNEDAQYAEVMKAVDAMRDNAEMEEKEMRQYLKNQMKRENEELAQSQRKTKQQFSHRYEDCSREEILAATSLNAFSDNAEVAMDSHGKIIKKDLFKGYTDAQKRRLWRENEEIRLAKLKSMEDERQLDSEWALQQAMINRAMEVSAYEEKLLRDQQTKAQMETIRDQMKEQQSRRDTSKKEKFGTVTGEFFGNFGTSCR